MGKKYIIELEDKPFHKEDGDFLYRVKGFNSLVFDMNGIGKLTPYAEPDLEQVRKEGYEQGYKDMLNEVNKEVRKSAEEIHAEITEDAYKSGYDTGLADAKCGYENGFENGMIVAWEAARKICTNWVLPDSVLSKIFGMDKTIDDIMKESTASEAIEKIRAYEQEQDAEIKVGDEVELKCGVRPAIYMQGTKGSDEIYLLFNDGSCGVHSKSEIERKTGRHFPEIPTVLEKMRGEQDG